MSDEHHLESARLLRELYRLGEQARDKFYAAHRVTVENVEALIAWLRADQTTTGSRAATFLSPRPRAAARALAFYPEASGVRDLTDHRNRGRRSLALRGGR